MRRAFSPLVGVMCLVCAWRGLAAQQVRGVVRDSATAAPLPGAVVSVVDSAGASAARTIADGAGRFSLLRTPRAVSLHVVRIGYRPRDLPIPPAAGDVTLEFALSKLPALLNAVRVSDRELCPGSVDRGAAFQLWEQARAGLLAAVVAREASPAVATTLVYERTVSPNDELVRRQKWVTRTGTTSRPFLAAASASTFATRGYMVEDAGGRVFSAPDADVLLDESFAATHCFHLQNADDAHRDQLGLAFAPAPGRDSLVDVSGVIWIDRTAPALRSFDFLFTDVEPAALRAGVGGHLDFQNLSNGVSFIARWSMRLPVMGERSLNMGSGSPQQTQPAGALRRQDRYDMKLVDIQEAGGNVLEAKWKDGTAWHDVPASITGSITQRGTPDGVPFALVTLAGTADTAMADARGVFALTPVLPGRYNILAMDTTLSIYAAPRTNSRRIEVVRGQTARYDAQFAPVRTVIADVCKGQRIGPRTATLVGRIALPNGEAPRNAVISANWQAMYNNGSDVLVSAGGPVTIDGAHQEVDVDNSGRFVVCGVAMERRIHLRITLGHRVADTTVTVFDSLLKSIDWQPSLTLVAADAPASLTGLVVREPGQMPVPGVEVSIPSLRRTTITDADGTFQLSAIPPGGYQLHIVHAGDRPIVDSIQLGPAAQVRRMYTFGNPVVRPDPAPTAGWFKISYRARSAYTGSILSR